MKVLHVPFTYYPDSVGGTEVYVHTLARGLGVLGIDSIVCAPGGEGDVVSDQGGIRVHRFRTLFSDASSLYGHPRSDVAAFSAVLESERPDIVHFHAFVGGLTPGLAVHARQRDIPVIYTYHTPTALCPRGDLLYMGRSVCEGILDPKVCARCVMKAKGASVGAAVAAGLLPAALKSILARALTGRYRTALTLQADLGRHKASFADFVTKTERVVAVCDWASRLLRANGVPAEKILLCRHGIEAREYHRAEPSARSGPLRLLYAGRLSADKGIDVVVRALRSRPDADVTLDIRGGAQSEADERYTAELRRLSGDDPRVRILAPYTPDRTFEVMAGYDAVVVPSVWMETGPLVVLEAFAAGVPVLASRRGGMQEIVVDGVDGLLLPPGEVDVWARAIEGLALDPVRLSQLKMGVRDPRTIDAVAAEMSALYRSARKGRSVS